MKKPEADPIPGAYVHHGRGSIPGLEIVPIRELRVRQAKTSHRLERPHRLDFFSALLVTGGEGDHFIDFRPYRYAAGSLLFSARGQVHAFGNLDDMEEFQILFTESFALRHGLRPERFSFFCGSELSSPAVSASGADRAFFSGIVRDLSRECSRIADSSSDEIAACLVRLLLLRSERIAAVESPAAVPSGHRDLYARFAKMLAARYSKTRDADEYAAALGISYKHLNEVCKEVVGESAKRRIDRHVVLETKRLLAATDLSVKEIAGLTGFDEPTNFVKYFRARAGVTPARFRESLPPVF
jgi:AraC-like DNA-binding protein